MTAISSIKQLLLTNFFIYTPQATALYDGDGLLVEINKALYERFRIADKKDFIIQSLFGSGFLSERQEEQIRAGKGIIYTDPFGYSIVPAFSHDGKVIGYTLLVTDKEEARFNPMDGKYTESEWNEFLDKIEASVPDTILLVNNELVVERILACATDTYITSEAVGCPIGKLPGFLYPDELDRKIEVMVRKCLDSRDRVEFDLSVPRVHAPVVSYKVRMVAAYHKYVLLYIRNVTDWVEKEKENKRLATQLSENSCMLDLALKYEPIATFSFNFERFRACDRVHCQSCFQFHGATNHLLEKNKYICRSLSILRHPSDRTDFFFLFNEIRKKKLQEHTVCFRLRDKNGNFRHYEVVGKMQEKDSEGNANLIVGCIVDNQQRPDHSPTFPKMNYNPEKTIE